MQFNKREILSAFLAPPFCSATCFLIEKDWFSYYHLILKCNSDLVSMYFQLRDASYFCNVYSSYGAKYYITILVICSAKHRPTPYMGNKECSFVYYH